MSINYWTICRVCVELILALSFVLLSTRDFLKHNDVNDLHFKNGEGPSPYPSFSFPVVSPRFVPYPSHPTKYHPHPSVTVGNFPLTGTPKSILKISLSKTDTNLKKIYGVDFQEVASAPPSPDIDPPPFGDPFHICLIGTVIKFLTDFFSNRVLTYWNVRVRSWESEGWGSGNKTLAPWAVRTLGPIKPFTSKSCDSHNFLL